MRFERSDEMPRGMDSVYDWMGQFHCSRPLKNTARDFSDAVLLAEILAQLVPAWVQLHNYPSTGRVQQKLNNWDTLNRKVLTRLKCGISRKHQEDMANAVPGAIELLLIQVKRATAHSPFLQAKRAASSQYDASNSPRSQSSSAPCSPPSTPFPGKQNSSLNFEHSSGTSVLVGADELSHADDSAATSFSKLLEMMSETTEEFEDVMKPIHPKARNRANTAPTIRLNSQIRGQITRPLTPNYAKPTKSAMAMARPPSFDAGLRSHQPSTFVFPQKKNETSKLSIPDNTKMLLDVDKKHLPSDTNEFQEGSFVYFLSSEALPVAFSVGHPEDQAQVARVIRTLPSGECTLRLYTRVHSSSSPRSSPDGNTRSYFVTPHSIDSCSTLLHTIPNMAFDAETNSWEWPVRPRMEKMNEDTEDQVSPNPNSSPPLQRHFFTEVLARVMFTSANLTDPITQRTESMPPAVCFPCPRFAESFQVPIVPTVFPKVRVSLAVELPERFPGRSRFHQGNT